MYPVFSIKSLPEGESLNPLLFLSDQKIIIQEFPDPSDIELATEAAVTVTQASLASEKFFDVQYFQENINIRMNDNNSCIQVILDNEDLLLFFEKVLKAYVKSSENMQSHSKIIEDFTTYFSLFLDREFSE